MSSYGILRHVVLLRTDDSQERIAFTISVTRIGELRTTLAVTSNRSILLVPSSSMMMIEVQISSESSVLTRVTLHNSPEDSILQTHNSIMERYSLCGLVVRVPGC
jgi:hypothetical protein